MNDHKLVLQTFNLKKNLCIFFKFSMSGYMYLTTVKFSKCDLWALVRDRAARMEQEEIKYRALEPNGSVWTAMAKAEVSSFEVERK